MPGDGTVVERVTAVSNGGPGIVVGQGSVIDSIANLNAAGAAIVGLIVRGSIATNNAVGIAVHPGGVAIGNSASYNGRGIYLTRATAANNTVNNNLDYGILNVCPGVLVGNTTTGNGTDLVTSGLCTLDDNSAAQSTAGQ
jgi:parallel beta-helix repeat protein